MVTLIPVVSFWSMFVGLGFNSKRSLSRWNPPTIFFWTSIGWGVNDDSNGNKLSFSNNFWGTGNPQGKVLINYSSTRLVEMMNHIFEIWEHYEYRRPPIENLGLLHLLEGWYKTYILSAAGEKNGRRNDFCKLQDSRKMTRVLFFI